MVRHYKKKKYARGEKSGSLGEQLSSREKDVQIIMVAHYNGALARLILIGLGVEKCGSPRFRRAFCVFLGK